MEATATGAIGSQESSHTKTGVSALFGTQFHVERSESTSDMGPLTLPNDFMLF
jgi:hypothetical protein